MYGAAATTADAAADSERTAFRKVEKRYKLYKAPSSKSRSKQRDHYLATDLSDVVDFSVVLDLYQRNVELPPGIFPFQRPGLARPVFCFRDRPGFYFIPGALSIDEQCHWIRQSLVSFPQPPNRTNHTAVYGPISDLFLAVQGQKVLAEVDHKPCPDGSCSKEQGYMFYENSTIPSNCVNCRPIPASVLLRKLRWSTLGLQFDWSKRNYDISLPHNKIPDALCLLSKKMAEPAMPLGEEFQPEAAIVNYFGPSDMLGGHLDDMEADWSKPIVSLSLGCKAIFLLGGKSREDLPMAMFLRSGDIVLMAGQARECFHGVPRIFTDEENVENLFLMSRLSSKGDLAFAEYVKTSRININIRQVN